MPTVIALGKTHCSAEELRGMAGIGVAKQKRWLIRSTARRTPRNQRSFMTLKFRYATLDFQGRLRGMIKRAGWQRQVQAALRRSRVAALIGPRQCGKTTLARQFLAV